MNKKKDFKESIIKLVRVTIENFKRVSFAEFDVKEINEIGGKNEAGKSSVIEAVTSTLGHLAHSTANIMKDRKYSKCTLVFDKFIVTKRVSKEGNVSMSVKDAQTNGKISSPQAFLDELSSAVIIDPTAFSLNFSNKERIETLYRITGIESEINDLDGERKLIYDMRTEVNRETTTLKGKLGSFPMEAQKEIELKSSTDLIKKLNEAQKVDQTYSEKETRITTIDGALDNIKTEYLHSKKEVESYVNRIEEIKLIIDEEIEKQKQMIKRINELNTDKGNLMKVIVNAPESEVPAIEAEIESLDEHNESARSVLERNTIRQSIAESSKSSSDLTEKLMRIDRQKMQTLKGAKLPENVGVLDGEILVDNRPWENQSTSQAIKTAMQIGHLDSSPLKLMTLSWNDLDSESREIVTEFVKKNNYTAFIETVCDAPTSEDMMFVENGELVNFRKLTPSEIRLEKEKK